MRVPIYMVAVPILATAAFAQDTPPPAQPPKQPVESAQPAENPNKTKSDQTADQKSADQKADKSSTQSADKLPEMKTQKYSGTLMDASCAGSSAPAAASASSTTPPDSASASSADRTAPSTGAPTCTVNSSTTQFALKMKDGNTVRFDDVGNARVQEAIKTRKKWNESAAANKPIQVKANGVMNNDKLTVMSIN